MAKPKHIINHHAQNIWIYIVGIWTIQMPPPGPPGLRSEPTEPPFLNTWHTSLGREWEEQRGIFITPSVSSHFSQTASLLVSYTAGSSLRGGMESNLLSSPPDHAWLSEAKWLGSEVGHTEPHRQGKQRGQQSTPRGLEHSPQQGLRRGNWKAAREKKWAGASTRQWAVTASHSAAFTWSLAQACPDSTACNASGSHHIHENWRQRFHEMGPKRTINQTARGSLLQADTDRWTHTLKGIQSLEG